LARNKNNDKINGIDEIKVEPVEWVVDYVELMESELTPQGPKYAVLESFKLL
jgi:2'-5' RNA ligase